MTEQTQMEFHIDPPDQWLEILAAFSGHSAECYS